jgi:hypothetical protein
MDKKTLASFVSQKKKGVYNLLIEAYADVLSASMSTPMVLELIRQDLQTVSREPVELNRSSLLKAISKAKKRGVLKSEKSKKKFDFKDSYELKEEQRLPGSFTV